MNVLKFAGHEHFSLTSNKRGTRWWKNYLLLHNLDFKAIPSRASTDADVINTEHLHQVRPSNQVLAIYQTTLTHDSLWLSIPSVRFTASTNASRCICIKCGVLFAFRSWHPTLNAATVNLSGSSASYPVNKKGKGKGKAIPLQAWTGPEGSRGLRLPDFKTIGTWRW